jgi:SAM-dependent methyltransferase|tara:strand:- start:5688 stop:6404 length:717 start_codon:yes stop_codon:yes gene_type:complete
MTKEDIPINFTGEFFIPGKSEERIEADHMERYHFACEFAQGKSILDIACGVGYSAPLFINTGAVSYVGVDINEKLIKYANQTYGSDCISYHLGDICTFHNTKTYDIITCFETIEHIEDYNGAINNLYSLLNRKGILFISSPNRPITSPGCSSLHDKPRNKFHIHEFIPEELILILTNYGFIVNQNDIYGQRQRKVYSNYFINKIYQVLMRKPDTNLSAMVTPVREKVPRYFVITATKE